MRLSLLNLNGSTNALWRIDVAERAGPGVGERRVTPGYSAHYATRAPLDSGSIRGENPFRLILHFRHWHFSDVPSRATHAR